ncbi:IPT/TIG domain-containing protein [Sphingomonas sp. NIBR02145]|nr:IPT/TIG domain-containing protein [Sphingomonas sp. NIBR02145]WHU02967.1 IPT/TIG domain-containing protein [Sphingomonas sp. NIBR02145]
MAAALLFVAPNTAWALSSACTAINSGQYVNNGRAGGQNPTAMSGTYGFIAPNGNDENITTSANLVDTFAPGEIISWSYTKTTNVYLHIYLTDSNYNLITGTNSYDRTAASGSGSFTIVNSGDIVGVRLDAGSFGGGPNISGPTNGTASVTISCSAPTPVLGVSMTHSGNASQGGSLAYTITPSTTTAPTSTATLTAAFTLPTGMTYSSATGTGWSCSGSGQTGSCTRTTSIGTGNGPTITLNTSFASNATTPLVPQVQLSGGGASNSPTATDSTVVNQTPTVTSVSPTAGPTGGGTSVTITGTNFSGTTGAAGVKFGAANATGYTVNSSTQITATAPANSAGTYDITVTNAGLTSATSGADQYTYVTAPTVTSVSPTAGPTAGGTTVTITGTGFAAANPTGAVKFGATTATYTINSNTQITATSPANSAGTYDITVATPGGTSATSAADQFTYIPAPTITSISPTAGPTGGGTSVTITGTNFTGVTAVTFGGTAATGFTFVNATTITATSPAGSAGTVDIRVTTSGGTSATSASDQFTYIAAPTVTSVSPIAGPTGGGQTVTITGTGFAAAPGTGAVKFGVTNATYTINSNTQITATSPANAAGTYDVTVATPGGTSATSAADQYTYVSAPTVTSVSPTAGPTSGGTTVTITGTGFAAAPGTGAVKFGATTATYTINSSTQITATSPASAAGTYDITVATPGGTSATSAADQYTYIAPPVASSYTAAAVAYDISNTTFSVASHATNSPTNYAVGSATTAQGGSVSVDSSGTVTYTTPSGFRGNDSFTFTATNLGGTSAPATVTVPVNNPTLLFTFPVGSGTRGVALSNVRIDTTGGRAPYTCGTTLNTGSLPAGTQLNADCTITGTPAASGTFTFTATVTDSSLGTGPYTMSTGPMVLTIGAPTISISPASGALPGATVGTSYSQSFTASGGTAGYTYARTLGTLPTGVTLSGGTLSGTPTTTGTFNFDITATDGSTAGSGGPYTRTQSYSVTVSQGAQTISFGTLSNASLDDSPLTLSATASSGLTVSFASTTTSVCTVSGTTLTLHQTGTCSVTASQGGDGNWTAAPDVSRSFTVTPANLTINASAATGLQVGASYNQANTASGGVAPYTYTLSAGAFVPGTTLNGGTGVVSGSPTVAGSFSYIIRATDAQGPADTADTPVTTVNIAKGNQTISFNPSTAPSASVGGAAYNVTASATSGLTPILSIDASATAICTISGGSVTFQATGTCLINANQAGDSNWNAAPQAQQSVTVGAAGAIGVTVNFSTSTLGVGQTGTATITFTNPNASASPNIAPLFSGSALVSRGALGGSCGASGSDSGANFQFNGFSIPSGSCTVTISYTGTTAGSSAGFSLGAFTPSGYPTTSAAGSSAFAVVPTVTGVSPNTGPVSQVVTISGTGFSTTPGNNTVTFGSAGNGNVTAASATSLTVTAPVAGSGAKAVTVSVNGQTSTTSATFTFIDKPIAADKPGVSVPYNSAGTAIDLSSSITGGPHSSIAIGTVAQHGTTTISGDVVTYTPTAGYFGADFFTYTATGAGGTSNVARVDITVATPAAPVTTDKSGVAIPYNGTGTGIDLSTSISGVHSSIAIGTPPQHGSVSIAGDVVTYTPTTNYYGGDSFTFTATGPGGTSAPAQVTVTVANPPAPVANDKNGVTVPYASTGTAIDLSTSITGVHSGIAVGTVPAHGTVTVAGDVATYTPNATHYGADSFTYTVTGPGGTSAPATVNITVGLPPAPVSTDKSGVAVPYASTGTAIDLSASITGVHSGVAVGTAPAHGSVTVAGDVATYTPSATYYGADSFSYVANGPGGASNVSTVTLTVATPAAPTAADKTGVAVPYASTGTAIDLSASITGVHSAIAIGTAPAHGTVTIAGDVVTYTPAATYYGADSFTFTATGPGGTSAPATVSITVGLPPAPVAADKPGVAVPYASTGTAIDLSASITGVHSAIAIGTAPTHGTVVIAGDVVTYTPAATYYGADSFTFTATGPGGTSAPATVSITVATPPAPVAANKTGVAVGYNSAGTAIDLAPSITGVHASITISTAPTHGTATVSGDVVTYVPTTGYYGADSFAYTATGPGGTSAAATVGLTVATPPPPSAAPGTGTVPGSTTTAGTSVQINLSSLVTGVYDSIQIASQPAHGTVTLSGGAGPSLTPTAVAPVSPYVATYTPAANYAGTDSFTFTATGPGGTSSPGTVTITVVGQVPIATPKTATAGDGQMVSVMLTDGATRGPITGATVVSISPANSATTTIVAAGNGTYRLDVTPNNRFGGQIVVNYTLSNIFGASAPSTVTLTVQARPDPRNDPDIAAISDAQAETARRFARAQVSNFMRRTEQLHNGGGATGLAMGVTLGSRDGTMALQRPDDKNWGLAITDRMRVSGEDPAIGQFANNPQSPLSRADQLGYGRTVATTGGVGGTAGPAKAASGVDEDGKRRNGSVATWAGGAIDIGTRDKRTDRSKITATTAGLSAGADIKLSDDILVGLGGGYGNDLSRIGTAAQVRGTSTIYAAYASIQPASGTFIDGMVGRGQLDFTTRRLAAAVNATARGSRDGSYTVAAISLGIDRAGGPLQWSLYGRAEYLDADLDAYAESGAGRYNLRFDARQVRSVTGTLGGRLEYRQKVSFGSITPRIRAEWNHEFADVDAQWLDYADIPGAALYDLAGNGWKREQLQLSIGTRFDILSSGWSFDFETGLRAGQGERAGTLQIRLSKRW